MTDTDPEGERMVAEFMAKLAAYPLNATYALATMGSRTERGGEVVEASSEVMIDGHRIACVGDSVRYPDGTQSKIISGAGFALTFNQWPIAIVGSETDIGDKIVSSLQNQSVIRDYADEPIPGLLDPNYRPVAPSAA